MIAHGTRCTVQSSTRTQWGSLAVANDVRAVVTYGNREIADEAAVAIAAWWQSSGTVGRHLATLASGLPVDLNDLLDDIHHTRREVSTEADYRALDCLATWALNHSSREEG